MHEEQEPETTPRRYLRASMEWPLAGGGSIAVTMNYAGPVNSIMLRKLANVMDTAEGVYVECREKKPKPSDA